MYLAVWSEILPSIFTVSLKSNVYTPGPARAGLLKQSGHYQICVQPSVKHNLLYQRLSTTLVCQLSCSVVDAHADYACLSIQFIHIYLH